MLRRPVLFAVVIATVSASSLVSTATPAANASEELCFGQVPTMAGTPGEEGSVLGTRATMS